MTHPLTRQIDTPQHNPDGNDAGKPSLKSRLHLKTQNDRERLSQTYWEHHWVYPQVVCPPNRCDVVWGGATVALAAAASWSCLALDLMSSWMAGEASLMISFI